SQSGRIGVIGTRATVGSNSYRKAIAHSRPGYKVFAKACPLLVPLVEEGWITRRETKMILRKYLYSLKNQQIDTLILGCTHYPLLKHLIQPRIGKKVTLIDSSVEVAIHLHNFLKKNPVLTPPGKNDRVKHRFFVTDLTETTRNTASVIFNRPIHLQLA
ncbi:MAG: aspartate/glutamate racemase family protein, partial [Deltaproteobacteria bacterium]|nr:aspartate/glutamate racemase family protein [Deltaproteobacteria bacterium]